MGESAATATGWRGTLKYLTYTGLASSMGHVPEPVARMVVGGVTRTMAWRGGSDLAMNERHMHRVLAFECEHGVLPDRDLVRRWSRRSFVEYGRYWIDGARLPYTGEAEIRSRWILGPGSEENLRAAQTSGRGMVMALPHVGSWEWGGAWLALEGMPMTAVVERIEPARLFEWFVDQRRQMGLTAVPLGDGVERDHSQGPAEEGTGRAGQRPRSGWERGRGRLLRRADHVAGRRGDAGAAHGRGAVAGHRLLGPGKLAHWGGAPAPRHDPPGLVALRHPPTDAGAGDRSSNGTSSSIPSSGTSTSPTGRVTGRARTIARVREDRHALAVLLVAPGRRTGPGAGVGAGPSQPRS